MHTNNANNYLQQTVIANVLDKLTRQAGDAEGGSRVSQTV